MNPLVGKTVTAVYLADDKGAIKFDVADGEPVVALADGDCCSHTWIENVEAPEFLIGSPVLSVDDLDMPHDCHDTKDCDDVIAFYGCKITTANGAVVIDYRNSSNGYYGGWLEWDQSKFYGGVHGQNKSKMDWKKIA